MVVHLAWHALNLCHNALTLASSAFGDQITVIAAGLVIIEWSAFCFGPSAFCVVSHSGLPWQQLLSGHMCASRQ
jgi:hypothetical protein